MLKHFGAHNRVEFTLVIGQVGSVTDHSLDAVVDGFRAHEIERNDAVEAVRKQASQVAIAGTDIQNAVTSR